MDDLISRSALIAEHCDGCDAIANGLCDHDVCGAAQLIMEAPAIDAVSRAIVEQIQWERDTAIQQLKDHHIPFGGIAPDVVKVVRCCECIYRDGTPGQPNILCYQMHDDDFCSYGKRRADDGK